ncbi:hypothetical protein NKR23_g5287 [Pleurostoma richardsiae]|uniref:Carbohydrate kinase FGGY N-terminal domain-containing protein n=1 Tax=Pleurostoma richardsiae TaxID=41990 RepID=A0AA38S276_9PEZI|nr:hypothetical protein NKR23_g5287 [Pleurostoma richardsiae]
MFGPSRASGAPGLRSQGVLLLILILELLPLRTLVRGTGTSTRGGITIGVDLGQSYGSCTARWRNGTVTDLAKVAGSPRYVHLMEQLVQEPATPHWLGRLGRMGYCLGIWRLLKRAVGLPGTHEAAILPELLAALKAQSEVALGSSIDVVSVTAPAMAAWQNSIPVDSVVNDALVLAELEPWSWEASAR